MLSQSLLGIGMSNSNSIENPAKSPAVQENRMNLSNDRRNPFLIAYSLVRRSGFLQTSFGRRLFKSAYFLYKRYIEDDLRDLLRSHPAIVGEGNVLDIGANIGYTAAVMARAAQADRKVYAFEPEPFNFKLLQQTALQTQFACKIVPMQLAVGAADGIINLWINDRHHADHRVATEQFRSAHPDSADPDSNQVSVPLVSIDSFLQSNPGPVSFVKVDVQGYELAVCQGMTETLRQNPGIKIVLEFMPSAMRDLGFEPSHLIDFLIERDFKVYQIHPRGKLSPGVPDSMNDSGYCDLLFSRTPIPCDREK
jgi:FkbM family methyltransferase